jgi:hypothetical protein
MKIKFTGHDTFPLKYGWLYKAAKYIHDEGKFPGTSNVDMEKAVVSLGVGKNMVKAIQYWSEAVGFTIPTKVNNITEQRLSSRTKYFFDFVPNSNLSLNHDKYLEHKGSIWLIHFWLNYNTESLTAYRYFFNFANAQYFDKNIVIDECHTYAESSSVNEKINRSTVKKDFDCFLNTYSKKIKTKGKRSVEVNEDNFASPLSELNLIQEAAGGFFTSNFDSKESLPIEIFLYAICQFTKDYNSESKLNTVEFDTLLANPFSPGRIFRLSEQGLGAKLDQAQSVTNSEISWIDSRGLRQINIASELLDSPERFLEQFYTGL